MLTRLHAFSPFSILPIEIITFGSESSTAIAGTLSVLQANRLPVSPPGFLLERISLALYVFRYDRKTTESKGDYKISFILLQVGLPACAIELHPTEAAEIVVVLRPFFLLKLDLILRGYLRRTQEMHFINSTGETVSSHLPDMIRCGTYITCLYKHYMHYIFLKLLNK